MQEKLKQIPVKLKNWWTSTSKKLKLLLAAGLVVVLAIVVAIIVILSNRPYATLFTGLTQTELNEIVTYLSDNGITDYRIEGNDTVLVPEAQVYQLKADLAMANYPTSGYGYELYLNNVGSLTTESERIQLQLYDLQENLAATIRCFDNVEDASVNLTPGSDNTYILDSDNMVEATASVTVQMREGTMLTDQQAQAIRNLVSGAVQNLSVESVNIQDTAGNTYSAGDILSDIQDVSNLKLRLEEQVNNKVRTEVLQVLTPLYGADNIRVSVSSVVDVDRRFTDSTNYSQEEGDTDGRGIIGTEIWSDEIVRGTEGTAGGVAGTTTNSDINTYVNEQLTPDGTESVISSDGERDYLVDETNQQVEHLAGTVSDLMVSVTINQTTAGEENVTDLIGHVARAAGISTADQADKISILVQPFYEEPVIPVPVPEGIQPWVLYAAAGGLALFILLLVIILLVLRRRKKKRLKRLAEEAAAMQAANMQAAPEAPKEGAVLMEMSTEKSMELRRDVRKFAEENPEIAAQMVKSWLREGGDGA